MSRLAAALARAARRLLAPRREPARPFARCLDDALHRVDRVSLRVQALERSLSRGFRTHGAPGALSSGAQPVRRAPGAGRAVPAAGPSS